MSQILQDPTDQEFLRASLGSIQSTKQEVQSLRLHNDALQREIGVRDRELESIRRQLHEMQLAVGAEQRKVEAEKEARHALELLLEENARKQEDLERRVLNGVESLVQQQQKQQQQLAGGQVPSIRVSSSWSPTGGLRPPVSPQYPVTPNDIREILQSLDLYSPNPASMQGRESSSLSFALAETPPPRAPQEKDTKGM